MIVNDLKRDFKMLLFFFSETETESWKNTIKTILGRAKIRQVGQFVIEKYKIPLMG